MAEIIKIRCNGPTPHVNEVNLSDALREQPIARQVALTTPLVPERIVLQCTSCTEGRVILTRSMIEEVRQSRK
jgi:hypothetical protein